MRAAHDRRCEGEGRVRLRLVLLTTSNGGLACRVTVAGRNYQRMLKRSRIVGQRIWREISNKIPGIVQKGRQGAYREDVPEHSIGENEGVRRRGSPHRDV